MCSGRAVLSHQQTFSDSTDIETVSSLKYPLPLGHLLLRLLCNFPVLPSSSLQSCEFQRSKRCTRLLGQLALFQASFPVLGIVAPYLSTRKPGRSSLP